MASTDPNPYSREWWRLRAAEAAGIDIDRVSVREDRMMGEDPNCLMGQATIVVTGILLQAEGKALRDFLDKETGRITMPISWRLLSEEKAKTPF